MVVHAVATCQLKITWNLIQEHSEDNNKFSRDEKRAPNPNGGGGGRGVLRISDDRSDQRIFFVLKFSISGFVWVGNF